MRTIFINNLKEIFNLEALSIMLGNFDGFHLGHQKLLEELKKINTKKALLTFYPHPLTILNNRDFKYLDTIEDKEEHLNNQLDYLIVLKTSKEILESSKEDFIDFLKLNNVVHVVCGKDYTFARNKEGTVRDLFDFNCHIVEDYKIDGVRVSSTLIRKYLSDGDIHLANQFLGRNYSVKGLVVEGSKIGRTIGFPTANVEETIYLLPKNGVYFGYTTVDNKRYKAMINIGINPTINLVKHPRLEAHILDFNQDIYGKVILIEFVQKLRDEQKFNSKEELIDMLYKNKIQCEGLS